MLQKIEIIGNLVQDAEVKQTKEGKEFISFRVAVTESAGEEKRTTYFDVNCARSGVLDYLKKGRQVYISGRLSLSAVCRDDKAFLNANVSARDLVLISGGKDN